MPDAAAWNRLRDISVDQFGLFTTVHAERHGISRNELTRRARAGVITRVRQGAYHFTDNPTGLGVYTEWAAVWLAIDRRTGIESRRAQPECIVSHESAAVLHRLGGFNTDELSFSGPRRITMRYPRLHSYRGRDIGPRGVDWTIVEGFPAATPGRIIADLARDSLDMALQGAIITDVIARDLISVEDVASRLDPHVKKWDADDGRELTRRFTHAAALAV